MDEPVYQDWSKRSKYNPASFWSPESGSQKRKREDEDWEKLQSSKRNQGSSETNQSTESSQLQLSDPHAIEKMNSTSLSSLYDTLWGSAGSNHRESKSPSEIEGSIQQTTSIQGARSHWKSFRTSCSGLETCRGLNRGIQSRLM